GKPASKVAQLRCETLGDKTVIRASFHMSSVYLEKTRGTICPEIDTRHQSIVHQKWQDIIAVLALSCRRVDFHPIAEPEQPFRPVALPDQRIERRKQGSGVDAPRQTRRTIKIGRLPPTLDCGFDEVTRIYELADARPGVGEAE